LTEGGVFYYSCGERRQRMMEKLDEAKLVYGMEEAAWALGVSATQVRNWIRRGVLKAFRVGRRVLIRREVLEEFVREMEAGRVM